MAAKQTPAERIADIEALIADIQDCWSDSDEQQIAFFEVHVPELHAEIAAIRAAVETAAAAKAWKAATKRAAKAIDVLNNTSGLDHPARHTEAQRIERNIRNAEQRAFDRGFDVADAAEAIRATIAPARDAAGRWYIARLESMHFDTAPRIELSEAERQYRGELRGAFA